MNSLVFPKLGRGGLGNMLFPWARAVLLAEQKDHRLIDPSWRRPRVGPYMRGERDKRQYHKFLKAPSFDAFLKDRAILAMATLRGEQGNLLRAGIGSRSVTVVSGMSGRFRPLMDQRALVQRRFDELVATIPQFETSPVTMHIRRSDFVLGAVIPDGRSADHMATPLDWYIAHAQKISQTYPMLPILVCSDGQDDELAPLLSLNNVSRTKSAGPLDDLMTLRQSKIVIGSGSSFSAWATFLGEGHLVLEPGKNHFLEGWTRAIEADELPPEFLHRELGDST